MEKKACLKGFFNRTIEYCLYHCVDNYIIYQAGKDHSSHIQGVDLLEQFHAGDTVIMDPSPLDRVGKVECGIDRRILVLTL